MKAVTHSQYGNAEVLQVTTLERPVPQKNEVLIRVKAAVPQLWQWLRFAIEGLQTRRKDRVVATSPETGDRKPG